MVISIKQKLIEQQVVESLLFDLVVILSATFDILDDGTPVINDSASFEEVKQTLQEFNEALVGWKWYNLFQEELSPSKKWVDDFLEIVAREEKASA